MRFVFRCGMIGCSRALLAGAALAAGTLRADEPRPLLSPIFGDHMVLQQGRPNAFWGWAPPGQAVRVTVADQSAAAVAGPDGRWRVAIAVPRVGGPYVVRIDGDRHAVLQDVLVGEVWLCGGQSNMALALRVTDNGEAEAQRADHPALRLCQVPTHVAYAPAAALPASWQVCSPHSAAEFSAVAYYFGRKLQEELHVPIGLIEDCVGGSPAESWMSAASLAHLGEFGPQLAEIARLHLRGGAEYGSFLMHWLDEHDGGGKNDAWAQPAFADRSWRTVPVPGGFRELGVPTEPAVVWFRREVTLPDPLPVGPAQLCLGVVERMDTAYVNGHWVGASSWVENPRIYPVPAGLLRPGRNVIAVRIFKTRPAGGFESPAATLRLAWAGGLTVPLAGDWRAAVSCDARPPASLPLDFDNYPTMPTVLYDGMIAPVAPLAVAGAIWYQGEANTGRPPAQYRRLLPALIANWREDFGRDDLPFYIVGLPAFGVRRAEPGTDGWAELREVQAFTAQTVAHTGLATTIDTGEADNIHPKNKRPVGERLALCALAGTYGRAVDPSGPTLRAVERRGPELWLHFAHAAGGLRVRGATLGEFSVAGADRQWHWARARLEGGEAVVVSAPEVPNPEVVRYAWQSNPLATLGNAAGLPAMPFRTGL